MHKGKCSKNGAANKYRNYGHRGRMFHNEELHILYRSPNIVRVIKSIRLRWAGHVARIEEIRNALKILTRTPEGKRPSGKPR